MASREPMLTEENENQENQWTRKYCWPDLWQTIKQEMSDLTRKNWRFWQIYLTENPTNHNTICQMKTIIYGSIPGPLVITQTTDLHIIKFCKVPFVWESIRTLVNKKVISNHFEHAIDWFISHLPNSTTLLNCEQYYTFLNYYTYNTSKITRFNLFPSISHNS